MFPLLDEIAHAIVADRTRNVDSEVPAPQESGRNERPPGSQDTFSWSQSLKKPQHSMLPAGRPRPLNHHGQL